MFITPINPLITNLKPIINKQRQENNKIVPNKNFMPACPCDVYFSGNKQEIIGKEVARTKISK